MQAWYGYPTTQSPLSRSSTDFYLALAASQTSLANGAFDAALDVVDKHVVGVGGGDTRPGLWWRAFDVHQSNVDEKTPESVSLTYRALVDASEAAERTMPAQTNVAPADVRALLHNKQGATHVLAVLAVMFAARKRDAQCGGWWEHARKLRNLPTSNVEVRVAIQTLGSLGSTALWRCRNDTHSQRMKVWGDAAAGDASVWNVLDKGVVNEIRRIDVYA